MESQAKQQMNKSIEMDDKKTWLEIMEDVILLALGYTDLCTLKLNTNITVYI